MGTGRTKMRKAAEKTANAVERAVEVFDRNSHVLVSNAVAVLNQVENTISREIRGARLQETTARFRELLEACEINLDYTFSDIRQVVRHLNSSLTKLDTITD